MTQTRGRDRVPAVLAMPLEVTDVGALSVALGGTLCALGVLCAAGPAATALAVGQTFYGAVSLLLDAVCHALGLGTGGHRWYGAACMAVGWLAILAPDAHRCWAVVGLLLGSGSLLHTLWRMCGGDA